MGGHLRTDRESAVGRPGDTVSADATKATSPGRRLITALACVLVLSVLIAPSEVSRLTPAAFIRIPVEGLLGIALVLLLPARPRRIFAWFGGVTLGLLAIVKIISLGFSTVLDRSFDPVFDGPLLKSAVVFLRQSSGQGAAISAVIAAVIAALLVLLLVTLSFVRLTRLTTQYRARAASTTALLGTAWVMFAVTGAQIVPGVSISAHDYYDSALQVRAAWKDRAVFAAEAAVDAFRDAPGEDMLTALRGKDVVLTFVESYGRVAIEDPQIAPEINALLDAGDSRLRAAGFTSRSAFLSSPTAGGGSWLAQSTLLSGLWIDNQQRYRQLTTSDRLTLAGAFQRADWRTVAVSPATTMPWPEGAFFGYDRIYAARDLGYRGPAYSFATMPDQYTLSTFQRSELAVPGHPPVMAAISLISSHAPWKPVPRLMAWEDIGDGSVFDAQTGGGDPAEMVLGRDRNRIRADYRHAIGYSLESLISYVETYGDDKLVLVFLGDHQPAPVVTGSDANRDVPITIVARDRKVLDR
ncbi:MAG: sulfatase, partial [Longispora sp.]|nr:sulfatase [Longispora sp. (in: high G+C Gram-positive bacteria)]